MASGSDSRTDVSSQVKEGIHAFGNASISDVIFLVGGEQFLCHKMLLAAKSDYFGAMFTSGFKEKDQPMIEIDADPIVFKNLMEIIYNGKMEDEENVYWCKALRRVYTSNYGYCRELWKTMTDLFALADRFLLTDDVRFHVENSFMRYDRKCSHEKGECFHSAVKLLLALRFKMDFYRDTNSTTKQFIQHVSGWLNDDDLHLSSAALVFLLGRD